MGKETEIKILHLETVREWRGGQQQIAYLVKGLLRNNIQTVLACHPRSEIMARFKRNRWPVFPVKMEHGLDIKAARQIARYIKENGFSIIHAHSSHALSLALLVKTMHRPVKLIASRRVDFSVKKPIVGSVKYNNPLIDRIVCISDNIARVLMQDGIKKQKLTVIHSGIDMQRFKKSSSVSLRDELGIPADHLIVGTVAALVGHKDYPTLLKAARLVCQNYSAVTFVAVGEGNDRSELETLRAKLGLKECFRFTGFRSDLERFYHLFDVFVLASYKEGLGTSVLDALAQGVPVVATRAGGIPEMIVHGQNGMLVPPRNPEQLAVAIERLLHDADFRKRLALRARLSVEKFDYQNMVQKHIALYRNLLT